MNETVTLRERYRLATGAKSLKLDNNRAGAVDLLIAAGWSDGLGIMLYRLAGEYDQVAQEVHRANSVTDAVMVMTKLKSLHSVRAALLELAENNAHKWMVNVSPQVTAIIVGRTLSAWLDPTCPACNGTGVIGGYDGNRANVCRKCAGTGQTRQDLGRTENERHLAEKLLNAMDERMKAAESMLRFWVG